MEAVCDENHSVANISDQSKSEESVERFEDGQSENSKPKTPKAKKRKKPKDSTAPRQPLSGYIRYLNDRRETVRAENPSSSFADITKMLASEWTNLAVDKKQLYLDAAEQDRERYSKEYEAYKQTDAYKLFTQQTSEKKQKPNKEKESSEKALNVNNSSSTVQASKENDDEFGNFDIPIFTEEFLDHNKTRDAELRQLRKTTTDYEQQNALLTKHIENMKSAIVKVDNDIIQQEKMVSALRKHLDCLRNNLSKGFQTVVLPGYNQSANSENIDEYMTKLHALLLENRSQDSKFMQVVRDVVAKMEFSG